jgi:leucyl aminopeptidase
MLDQDLGFVVRAGEPHWPLLPVRPGGLDRLLQSLSEPQSSFLRATGFKAAAQELAFIPAAEGLAGAVLGLGEDRSPYAFGGLAFRLPEGRPWRLEPGDYDASAALLGYCLGAYRYGAFKAGRRPPARLLAPPASEAGLTAAAATWMVRDLVNAPANVLGPAELADVAVSLAKRFGASWTCLTGDALGEAYPAIAAVGKGSARPPFVASLNWTSPKAGENAPLISLCGKGVCFDTGGYDLKPSAGMLRMKKDMAGAATVLGLARMIMEAQLPVRLAVRIGCVENSVSGSAMRPLDVIRTRRGLSVEIGNTDAEGRLVLCDLLAEASDERPDLLLDCATLTGAARVALGPDMPALFCNDEGWAERLLAAAGSVQDPLWRLPLWDGYDSWLDGHVADLNNVSSKPFAGAVIAALFLRRFINADVPWAHIDLYAWNDQTQPGRPEGGEAQAMRAVFGAIDRHVISRPDQNRVVT